jgi:hypothetical protein
MLPIAERDADSRRRLIPLDRPSGRAIFGVDDAADVCAMRITGRIPIGMFGKYDAFEASPSDPASLHKYVYAASNPLNLADPLGNFSVGYDVAAAVNMGMSLNSSGAMVAGSFGMASGLNPRDINPFLAEFSDQVVAFAQWMNDRPPGAAEGWENWVPLYGSLKTSLAYFLDGRPGWGIFWGVMAAMDALLVGRVATALAGVARAGLRTMMTKIGLDMVADRLFKSYPTFRYVARAGAELGGADGATYLRQNAIFIADDLVGDELVATVRHELVHYATDAGGRLGTSVHILAYTRSDALRFAEEFLAEWWGKGGLFHSLQFAGGYVNPIKITMECGVYVARIGVNLEQSLMSHGVEGVF